MLPTSKQRPLSRFPEVRGRVDSRRAGQAPPLCLSPPLSGRAVLLASRKLSDLPGRGCHLKAACPRRLTPWRQEPAPTVTSNNPHTQYRKHFSKATRGPMCHLEAPGSGGWEAGCRVPCTVSWPCAAWLAQETSSRGLVAKGGLSQGGVRGGNKFFVEPQAGRVDSRTPRAPTRVRSNRRLCFVPTTDPSAVLGGVHSPQPATKVPIFRHLSFYYIL